MSELNVSRVLIYQCHEDIVRKPASATIVSTHLFQSRSTDINKRKCYWSILTAWPSLSAVMQPHIIKSAGSPSVTERDVQLLQMLTIRLIPSHEYCDQTGISVKPIHLAIFRLSALWLIDINVFLNSINSLTSG